MKAFDVLQRDLNLSHHYLLEASAGTGKTFSIENIFLRLLLEGDTPLKSEAILAVTFTRAAVADMKARIHANLENVLGLCHSFLMTGEIPAVPDFLLPVFERGEEAVRRLKRKVEYAIAEFDQAHIYTIHAFCARMLREHSLEGCVMMDRKAGEEDCSPSQLEEMAKDFLRTKVCAETISSTQLQILLRHSKGFDKLVRSLGKEMDAIVPIASPPFFRKSLETFVQEMGALKTRWGITGDKLAEDFRKQAPYYRKVFEAKELEGFLEVFCELFNRSAWTDRDLNFLIETNGFWNEALATRKKTMKMPTPLPLHYPFFGEEYRLSVEKLVREAANPDSIYSILAAACQQAGQRAFQTSERLGFNQLLVAAKMACSHSSFVEKVRERFRAVIIDEFQDTDPLQWDIFRTLFPLKEKSWGSLFLVGDPKQSIYSFRQADIYTYLSAEREIDKAFQQTLNRNFRSQPSLVHALNALFSQEFAGGFLQLPRFQTCLKYFPVEPGGIVKDQLYEDGKKSLHFQCVIKDKYQIEEMDHEAFCFVSREIHQLNASKGLLFSQFAVLVADRYQAQRVIEHLRQHNIPAIFQRSPSLARSRAVRAMRELLIALITPLDKSALKTALGGPAIGWTHQELFKLDDEVFLQKILVQCFALRQILMNNDFALFFDQFMQTVWNEQGQTVEEQLLSIQDNLGFYHEWNQLGSWMIEKHQQLQVTPERWMDDLWELENGDDEPAELRMQTSAHENAVQVLTIHSSKGLEFDIVFPVGLYKRNSELSGLITSPSQEGGYYRQSVSTDSPEYLLHCEESDAEKMRQLYVALTRAKYRLYLHVPILGKGSPAIGTASPIELFVSRCMGEGIGYAELYTQMPLNNLEAFKKRLHPLQKIADVSFSEGVEPLIQSKAVLGYETAHLAFPSLFEVPGKPLYLRSYTALTQMLQKKNTVPDIEAKSAPSDFLTLNKTAYSLPAGSEIGLLLHKLLEEVSFESMCSIDQPEDLLEYVRKNIVHTRFVGWESVIASILFSAVKTPFFLGVPPLAEIADRECVREMEFTFSTRGAFDVEGYLKGVIDLVFLYQGRYYLVDWKSNWLGDNAQCYQGASLAKEMLQQDYFLQAQIYREALKRYFEMTEKDCFGGTAYVFLRGLVDGAGIFNEEFLR